MPLIVFFIVVGVGVYLTMSGSLSASEITPDELLLPIDNNESNSDFGTFTPQWDGTDLHPLLKLIQKRESAGRYNVVFGGKTFNDFSTHPFAGWKINAPAPLGKGELARNNIRPAIITLGSNKGNVSTAAGKYQFNLDTWIDVANKIGRWDFMPDTQDALAYQLCVNIGAISAYNAGDFNGAIRKCAARWTSLPGSGTGESSVTMQVALQELKSYS
jgi:muramidase (phage lysozyme)